MTLEDITPRWSKTIQVVPQTIEGKTYYWVVLDGMFKHQFDYEYDANEFAVLYQEHLYLYNNFHWKWKHKEEKLAGTAVLFLLVGIIVGVFILSYLQRFIS